MKVLIIGVSGMLGSVSFKILAEDARALSGAVMSLYGLSVNEWEKMGDNGRSYYQELFDHENLVDQLIGHFQSMVSGEQ